MYGVFGSEHPERFVFIPQEREEEVLKSFGQKFT
jgi:hypothetical protein